jgi:peptidyl-prolyl cis-trans isomerase SurA
MATAQEAMLALQKGKNWKAIADESDGRIQSDSGRYEIAQIQVQPGVKLTEGLITNPLLNSGDNTANFVQVLKLFPANQQRSFEEARGLVINDFQGQLEEQWIGVLKKKSPVKVNEAVFQSMLK